MTMMPGWSEPSPEAKAREAAYMERERERRAVEHAQMVKRDAELVVELRSFVGQVLTSVEFGRRDVSDTQPANAARLTFADGRTIAFEGWGYDEWGLTVDVSNDPPNARQWKPVEP